MKLIKSNDLPTIPAHLTGESLDKLSDFITSRANELTKRVRNTKDPKKIAKYARQQVELKEYCEKIYNEGCLQIENEGGLSSGNNQ